MRGALMVCGTTSDAGKSLLVAGLCRWLARQGVWVAPFKAQNMANNASVTVDGAEIGHAQWVQAVAAGVEPTSAMNPVLLKPTGERTSQVVVRGKPIGELTAREYHELKTDLRPMVLDALDELWARHDVVICEGAGSPAEINLLDHDLVNLGLADAAGLPAIVVGDIDRGGVFAALYGTVALLPDELRPLVRGFVVNRLRGDPALLGDACAELERRCGVPTLGVLPFLPGMDLDAEDSLSGFFEDPEPVSGARSSKNEEDVLDVVAIRWPFVSNAGDLDPLRLEPNVSVRWVRSLSELGRPDLVVLPGSKATRHDLDWFCRSGLADAVADGDAAVVAVCAGLQMCGYRIDDPHGAEGSPGSVDGLGWLPVSTRFEPDKVLDRPTGRVRKGPGQGQPIAGYRIHHGRVTPVNRFVVRDGRFEENCAKRWLVDEDRDPLGWYEDRVCGTTLHGLFENDGFREAVLSWATARAGKSWSPGGVDFAARRMARLDRIADAIDTHLDTERLVELIAQAEPAPLHHVTVSAPADATQGGRAGSGGGLGVLTPKTGARTTSPGGGSS